MYDNVINTHKRIVKYHYARAGTTVIGVRAAAAVEFAAWRVGGLVVTVISASFNRNPPTASPCSCTHGGVLRFRREIINKHSISVHYRGGNRETGTGSEKNKTKNKNVPSSLITI